MVASEENRARLSARRDGYTLGTLTRANHGATSVCEKHTPPEKRALGILAWQIPKQGLKRGFCCWVAWQWLAQKECVFTDTGVGKWFN